MAGFFGIGDFTKEGPGIEKDAPEKKKIVVFFETFFRNFWKFFWKFLKEFCENFNFKDEISFKEVMM